MMAGSQSAWPWPWTLKARPLRSPNSRPPPRKRQAPRSASRVSRVPPIGEGSRPILLPEQAPERGLHPILERAADRGVDERRVGRVASLGQGVAQGLERGHDLTLGRATAGDRATRRRRGDPSGGDLLLELEDDPLRQLLADPRDRR